MNVSHLDKKWIAAAVGVPLVAAGLVPLVRRWRSNGAAAGKLKESARDLLSGNGRGTTAYEELTKDELYQRAQELDIEGRSTMDKQELVAALRNAQ